MIVSRINGADNRRKLYLRFNGECHWCGKVTGLIDPQAAPHPYNLLAATIDHVKCKAECASAQEFDNWDNVVLACYACNRQRSGAQGKLGARKWRRTPASVN